MSPDQGFTRIAGDAAGDAMKPRTERIPHPESSRLPRQDEEGRLEEILGLVLVAQETSAYAKHHRSVAFHQGCERVFGRDPPLREKREQVIIAKVGK